ncbi:hypothetical protein B0H66DRAFT_183454 [Apodospora peruviana]|uniref:Uncharacterized protein n=1 Tax=Apodospora peruviana TaxID=516989 RepID=A0AAE0IBL9_9PEZI|nr:hypothetical protein B0H66DRAFT_183454 [Apodospora peruviana]
MRRFLKAVSNELNQVGGQLQQQAGGGFGNYGPPQPPPPGSGFGGFGFPQPAAAPASAVPCPRKQPQIGFTDWIGLPDPRFGAFNVCPSCYNSVIRPTPYANAFVTKAAPPNVPIRCDMSRYWVKMAGLVLMTMNQDGRYDISLLARVAGVNGGECPNAQLTSEMQPLAVVAQPPWGWYTIIGNPIPGWTVCASCVWHIQTCLPAIANGFAPVQLPGQASCALVPSDHYDDARTAEMLRYVATCAVASAQLGRVEMSQLVSWLRQNPPRQRGGAVGHPSSSSMGGYQQQQQPQSNGLCPRNHPSTTLRCHTMQGLFDFTVCEQCYADVIRPDTDQGVALARQFEPNPAAIPSGFTCQLYSDRMRRVWREATSTGDVQYLRQKVSERRAKERELQMKTTQLQQQAAQLRQQAEVQQHLAANAMRVSANAASTNSMLAGVGVIHQVDAFHYTVPNGVPDFSQTTQLNNQATMLKVQAAQAECQIAMAEEEWKRYWE